MSDEMKNDLDGQQNDDANDTDTKSFPESVVKSLRQENASWRQKHKALKDQIDEMQGKIASVDMDKYYELLDKEKEIEKRELEKKGEFDKLREQLIKEHEKELKTKEQSVIDLSTKYERLDAELNTTVLSNHIAMEAATAKCLNPKLLELTLSQEAQVVIDEQTGRRSIKLVDEYGEPRVDPKTGKPFTIKQRIAEMKEMQEYAMLFEGAKAGSGSRTVNGITLKGNPFDRKSPHFNLTEQGRLYRDNPDLAKRLAGEVGMKLQDL